MGRPWLAPSSSEAEEEPEERMQKELFNQGTSQVQEQGQGRHQEKKEHRKKVKARAFITSLSDVNSDTDDHTDSSSSEEDDNHKTKKKDGKNFNGLCFYFGKNRDGYCVMALNADNKKDSKESDSDSETEVKPTSEQLTLEVEELNDCLLNQDKLLKKTARERIELKTKLESALIEIDMLKSAPTISDVVDCDECAVHKATLQIQLDNACAKIKALDKSDLIAKSKVPECTKFHEFKHALQNTEDENYYLCTVLSWVSSREPQLGMMIQEFKVADGFVIGNMIKQCRFDGLYEKVFDGLYEKVFDGLYEKVGGLEKTRLIDSDCSRHKTGDHRWFSSLTPVMIREYITFGDNSKGKVLSEGAIKVSENFMLKRVALVDSLSFNLLSVSQLLDDGFDVRFKQRALRILDS
nr:uncharacterized protein LOC117835774 [Setaria viridis]